MTLQKFCLVTWLSLVFARLSSCGEVDSSAWRQYSDPKFHFSIQYPNITESKPLPDQESGLSSRVAFEFEQSFQSGPDAGSLKFRFQISVWQNTNHLTAEAFAKQKIKPELTLETRSIQMAGRKGVQIKTTNLAWTILKTFVVDKEHAYELSYTDVAANKVLLPEGTRSYWTETFDKMLGSFRILPQDGGSN